MLGGLSRGLRTAAQSLSRGSAFPLRVPRGANSFVQHSSFITTVTCGSRVKEQNTHNTLPQFTSYNSFSRRKFHATPAVTMEHQTSTTKRKQPPTSTDRPSKRRPSQPLEEMDATKPYLNGGTLASADETPNGYGSPQEEDEDMEGLVHAAATADTAEWQATIEKVVRNVVSIHFCQTCAFDTD